MRIALAQINSVLGDFNHNKNKIIESIQSLAAKKADLIIFPEGSLFGYHPFDLLERDILVSQQLKSLNEIIKVIPKNIHVVIGGFEKNNKKNGRPYFNTAFLCTKNKIVKTFHKELLPTGDVFDEARFIEKGNIKDNYFKLNGKSFLITICEDIWAWDDPKIKSNYAENPIKKLPKKKLDLIINLSASPFHKGKLNQRLSMAAKTAKYLKAPLVYVNMVGAQDEIIYDGQSFILDKKGKLIHKMISFVEDENIYDLNTNETWSRTAAKETEIEQLRKALVLGIKDFSQKIGIKKVHLGLSGGIDSALVAVLAVDALGANNVKLFALPTQFNLSESFVSATQLAKNIGIQLKDISIESTFQHIKKIIDNEFKINEFALVHENLQSRIRGLFLMAYSNFAGSLLLTTGNKSEYATGYATLYGDMCGGLAVIGDLTKKEVYALCRLYNAESEIIPKFIIDRPPSAELRPNQKDQDSLPEYDLLDQSVVNIVEKKKPAKTKTDHWLLDQLMKTEFKRWQAAPILKISEHSFGRGRRYPLAHKAKG
jgi:NAD+ synthase (glutamine-hydrolysing)